MNYPYFLSRIRVIRDRQTQGLWHRYWSQKSLGERATSTRPPASQRIWLLYTRLSSTGDMVPRMSDRDSRDGINSRAELTLFLDLDLHTIFTYEGID